MAFPFGAGAEKTPDTPAGEACGPAEAGHGHELFKIPAIPGWPQYDLPKLRE